MQRYGNGITAIGETNRGELQLDGAMLPRFHMHRLPGRNVLRNLDAVHPIDRDRKDDREFARSWSPGSAGEA